MRAFHIHAPIPAAAVVLLLMNVATMFPLWPGNVGSSKWRSRCRSSQYGVATRRRRVRLRAAGDRDVGRDRRRADVPRARRAVVRDVARGCRTRARSCEMSRSRTKTEPRRGAALRALACPASLKGVLSAPEAAAALADGLREAGVEATSCRSPTAGEGTADALCDRLGGEWRRVGRARRVRRPAKRPLARLADGTAVVEAADAIPLDPGRLELLAHPAAASAS